MTPSPSEQQLGDFVACSVMPPFLPCRGACHRNNCLEVGGHLVSHESLTLVRRRASNRPNSATHEHD